MSDWHQLTPKEEELIRTAKPDQICIFRDGNLIRAQKEAVAAALEQAFRAAADEAMRKLDITQAHQLAGLDCEPSETWRTGYMRVTATDDRGRKESAIAMIADPREH